MRPENTDEVNETCKSEIREEAQRYLRKTVQQYLDDGGDAACGDSIITIKHNKPPIQRTKKATGFLWILVKMSMVWVTAAQAELNFTAQVHNATQTAAPATEAESRPKLKLKKATTLDGLNNSNHQKSLQEAAAAAATRSSSSSSSLPGVPTNTEKALIPTVISTKSRFKMLTRDASTCDWTRWVYGGGASKSCLTSRGEQCVRCVVSQEGAAYNRYYTQCQCSKVGDILWTACVGDLLRAKSKNATVPLCDQWIWVPFDSNDPPPDRPHSTHMKTGITTSIRPTSVLTTRHATKRIPSNTQPSTSKEPARLVLTSKSRAGVAIMDISVWQYIALLFCLVSCLLLASYTHVIRRESRGECESWCYEDRKFGNVEIRTTLNRVDDNDMQLDVVERNVESELITQAPSNNDRRLVMDVMQHHMAVRKIVVRKSVLETLVDNVLSTQQKTMVPLKQLWSQVRGWVDTELCKLGHVHMYTVNMQLNSDDIPRNNEHDTSHEAEAVLSEPQSENEIEEAGLSLKINWLTQLLKEIGCDVTEFVSEFERSHHTGQGMTFFAKNMSDEEIKSTKRRMWEILGLDFSFGKKMHTVIPNVVTFDVERTSRKALLIGNSTYGFNWSTLDGTIYDIAAFYDVTYFHMGFNSFDERFPGSTTRKNNLEKEMFMDAFEHFCRTLNAGDDALFYYCGHGILYQGTSYIVPAKTAYPTYESVEVRCIKIDDLIIKLCKTEARLKIFILDMCSLKLDYEVNSLNRGGGGKGGPTLVPHSSPDSTHPKFTEVRTLRDVYKHSSKIGQNVFLLYASPPETESREHQRGGIFTSSLVQCVMNQDISLGNCSETIGDYMGKSFAKLQHTQFPWKKSGITNPKFLNWKFHIPFIS